MIKKRTELKKIVTIEDDEYSIVVERFRTLDGERGIILTVGDQRIEFTSDSYNDTYEQAALSAGECLKDAAYDLCELDEQDG